MSDEAAMSTLVEFIAEAILSVLFPRKRHLLRFFWLAILAMLAAIMMLVLVRPT